MTTNYEKIKNMSLDEMAELLFRLYRQIINRINSQIGAEFIAKVHKSKMIKIYSEWLSQEVEE